MQGLFYFKAFENKLESVLFSKGSSSQIAKRPTPESDLAAET